MENGPCIDDFPIKTSIYEGFSMAMLNNQMVKKNPVRPANVGYTWLYMASDFGKNHSSKPEDI